MKRVSVLVIDDHELFRSGIELLIAQSFPTAEIILAAGVGEALDTCQSPPDVILLDYNLAGVSRDVAVGLVKGHWPGAQVIVVTAEQDPYTLNRIGGDQSLRLLPKSAPLSEFAEMVGACLQAMAAPAPAELAVSDRQIEILGLMREGHSNKAIARKLGLSEFTVRGHVQRILKLTGANNRTSAVFLAERAGILGPGRKSGAPASAGARDA